MSDVEVDLAESLARPTRPHDVLNLAKRAPARAFAAAPDAKRVRRPTDITLVIVTGALLLWAGVQADGKSFLRESVNGILGNLPHVLDSVWEVLHDLVLVWAAGLVLLAVVRAQWKLCRDFLVGFALTYVLAAGIGRAAMGDWPRLWDGLLQQGRPVDFPSLGLSGAVAIISIASPHLVRPLRYAGRWVLVLGALAFGVLGVTEAGHALGAVALGWAVAATIHLVFGSPGGVPSLERVRLGLAGMGIEAEPTDVVSRGGVVTVSAAGADGQDLDVKVFGRDAWDGQFLVSLWRFMWYRDSGPTLSLSRLQQVEHEAFLNLLADRRGAPVARVLAAGLDIGGDALLVAERVGVGFDHATGSDEQLASAWNALGRLHAAGIAMGAIAPTTLRVIGDHVQLADFSNAEVAPPGSEQVVDRAQLLVATATVVGVDRAVEAARLALGADGLAEVSSYVQPAALPSALRRAVDASEIDVDDVRKAVIAATDQPARELQRLRRLTWGRVLLALLLLVASWAFVSNIADIGLDVIIDSIKEATPGLLIVAFFIGFTPRFMNAVALSAAAPSTVPLGRLTALQLAITFVNLAMPATAARVAVNVRFFQRSGVDPTGAMTIGVLDSFTGFLGQLLLMSTVILFGLGSLHLDIFENIDRDAMVKMAILVVVLVAVAVLVIAVIPKLRRAVLGAWTRVWALVGPLLRSPRRFLTLLFANIAADMLFAFTMYITLLAFGQDVSYGDVIIVNDCVSLFAGLMPVPGGIGVTEAALTAGFISIGVDEATAFAVAITYRVLTYYTPPIIGFFAFRWLQRQRYL